MKAKKSATTDALFQEAFILMKQARYAEAAPLYHTILQQAPGDEASWLNLATALRGLGHFEAALSCAARALELAPDKTVYLMNYGNHLFDLDRKDAALAAYAKAYPSQKNNVEFLKNYGITLRDFCEFERALEFFDAALALQPNDPNLHWDRAMVYLHLGRFEEGWQEFEYRWRAKKAERRDYGIPAWQGEDLAGKTILVQEEQGFGDMILCCRYIPLLREKGAKVILECKAQLNRLFQTVPGLEKMVLPEQPPQGCDYAVSIMSLPRIFKTDLSNIPPQPPLFVPKEMPPAAAHLLSLAKGKLKVGIVWSGSTTFANNRRRAVRLSRFLPLMEIPGIQFYSLQKGPCEKEVAECGMTGILPELGPHVKDFADTAAVLKQLDLVIMTDSAVAHLAGLLDVPVWNLLSHYAYWLYLADREDSPWYKSMRLFRQKTAGDWDGVFHEVAVELRKFHKN